MLQYRGSSELKDSAVLLEVTSLPCVIAASSILIFSNISARSGRSRAFVSKLLNGYRIANERSGSSVLPF